MTKPRNPAIGLSDEAHKNDGKRRAGLFKRSFARAI
jgi:hypothetical protein